MLFRFPQALLGNRFLGWCLFGVGCALVAHFILTTPLYALAPETETPVYTGRTPGTVMEELFSGAPEGVDTEILILSPSDDYAIASYRWGEGGGYVVMQRDESEWQSLCVDGGAPNGGQTLVGCGVPLVDAQSLWDQYVDDNEAAGYAM